MPEDGSVAADILPLFPSAVLVAAAIAFALAPAWFVGSKARHGGAGTIPFESGIVPAQAMMKIVSGSKTTTNTAISRTRWTAAFLRFRPPFRGIQRFVLAGLCRR